MVKACKVCGKQFRARQANCTVCSPECRRINTLERTKQYNRTAYKDKITQYQRDRRRRYRSENPFYCKICGLSIDQPFNNRKTMHDECVLSEAAEYYTKNQKLNHMHYSRVYSRGYCIEDIIEVLDNG